MALNNLIKDILYYPAWIAYRSLGIIGCEELQKWIEVLKIDKGSLHNNFIWIFHNKPEYRSLLYLRLGDVKILKVLYPGQNSLHFEVESSIIGQGLVFQHGYSTIVNVDKLGKNCQIWQNVTLGKEKPGGGRPVVGDNVKIFTGAVVVGGITIGNNVMIGANAVVTKSVPDNCTVVGIPARIVKRNGIRVDEVL